MIQQARTWPRPDIQGEKWYPCQWCGGIASTIELEFVSGSVEPTVGEVMTGATSGDVATVVKVTLDGGTWAGGDAYGTLEMDSATGVTDRVCFSDNENLNGSVAGANCLTAEGDGIEKKYGRLYPLSELAFRDGKYWCTDHYNFQFNRNDRAEYARTDKITEDTE